MLEDKLNIIEEINKSCFAQVEESVTMNIDTEHGLQISKTKLVTGMKIVSPVIEKRGQTQ